MTGVVTLNSDGFLRYDKQPCPYGCGKLVDAAGTMGDGPPSIPNSGDFMICSGCLEPAVIEVDAFGRLSLRRANPTELAEFAVEHAHHIETLRNFPGRL